VSYIGSPTRCTDICSSTWQQQNTGSLPTNDNNTNNTSPPQDSKKGFFLYYIIIDVEVNIIIILLPKVIRTRCEDRWNKESIGNQNNSPISFCVKATD
jgi:hypothetical protein